MNVGKVQGYILLMFIFMANAKPPGLPNENINQEQPDGNLKKEGYEGKYGNEIADEDMSEFLKPTTGDIQGRRIGQPIFANYQTNRPLHDSVNLYQHQSAYQGYANEQYDKSLQYPQAPGPSHPKIADPLQYPQLDAPSYSQFSHRPRDDLYPARPVIPSHHGDKYASTKYNYEHGDDLKEALEHIDYIRWLVAGHSHYMQMNKCSYNNPDKGHDNPYYGLFHQGYTANSCEPKLWSKCNCMSPATYSDDGRGNCNLGATQSDLKVWCYVDDSNVDPATACPDSKISKSKPGYYWSRMACIT